MKRALALASAVVLLSAAGTPSPVMRTVNIEAVDYAFRVPATVGAGTVLFRLVNHGTVLHELQVVHFRGLTPDSVTKLISKEPTGIPPRDFSMGILLAMPGVSSDQRLIVDGKKGDIYGLICQFSDGPGKPKHRDIGMYNLIQVK